MISLNNHLIQGICQKNKLNVKCFKYFPQGFGDSVETQSLIIECPSVICENDLYRESMLTVYSKRTSHIIYQVKHFFLFGWEDHSVISYNTTKLLFKLIKTTNSLLAKYPKSPVLVHCSAGVGRTGTFLSVYQLYEQFLQAKEKGTIFKFSVYDTVLRLRYMRQFMVQTVDQYKFIHDFALDFFK